MPSRLAAAVHVLLLALAVPLAGGCDPDRGAGGLRFTEPAKDELRLSTQGTRFELAVPEGAVDPASVQVQVDDGPPLPPGQLELAPGVVRGDLGPLADGFHVLVARATSTEGASLVTDRRFEVATLQGDPDQCELLNDAECMLPYPSSRYQRPAATATGWTLEFPDAGMPSQIDRDDAQNNQPQPLSPAPYAGLDGYSPTVQILMHFPAGVDVEASNAPRLLPATRSSDLTSLEPWSPTLLIDWETGERIGHFIENDLSSNDDARRLTFLRPFVALEPNKRYIVAVRGLVDGAGAPVPAEPVFAALRDGRPTSIPAVEARRGASEALFARLSDLGVARGDLILAFDFHTRSDAQLTSAMLSMRDQAFAWLEQQAADGVQTFQVDSIDEHDCSQPGQTLWRDVRGTYQVPLFLDSDPEAQLLEPGFLVTDAAGVPQIQGVTNPPFGIGIPCSVLTGDPVYPLVFGHGLFGDGSTDAGDIVAGVGGSIEQWELAEGVSYIAGATRWRGLSRPDLQQIGPGPLDSWLVDQVLSRLNNFAALPDRLRQGQTNTLVLARMMKEGHFNVDPAFQTGGAQPVGVFPGPQAEAFYFGASLGGIMGLMFSALTPDVVKHNVDVPGMNFSFLLQRATPFLQFELLLSITGVVDPIQTALGIQILHELWVTGEPAGYIRHIRRDPLPGTQEKQILMTMAFVDQQVSNQATEVAARSLALPQLEGSLLTNTFLPGFETRPGPLHSAFVTYDTAGLDPANPAHAPYIPPLGNQQAEGNRCDPHGRRAFIPASLQQLVGFLRPDDPDDPTAGRIVNYCDGLCDGDFGAVRTLSDGSDLRFEIPFNDAAPCDPEG